MTLLAAASVFDLVYQKIPNKFVVLTIITGLFICVYCGRWDMLGGIGTAFVFAIPFYLIGAVGAGDVKIFMASGMMLETKTIVLLGWYALLMTAAYGLIYKMLCRGVGTTRVAMAPGLFMSAVILYVKGGMG